LTNLQQYHLLIKPCPFNLGNPKLGKVNLTESHSFLAKNSQEEVLKAIVLTETIQADQVIVSHDFMGKSNDNNQRLTISLSNRCTGDQIIEEDEINFYKVVRSNFIGNYNKNIIKRRIQK